MNTSLTNHDPQLLVCIETGRILRGDDAPIVTERWVSSHDFIVRDGSTVYAGPDAERLANARRRGEAVNFEGTFEYEVQSEVAGALRLQRVVTV